MPVWAIQERAVSENPTNGPQGKGYQQDVAFTLESRSKVQSTASRFGVRRLLPVEREACQGMERDWTRYGVNDKGETVELSDSARYRLIGNSVAIPVVAWIAQRALEATT